MANPPLAVAKIEIYHNLAVHSYGEKFKEYI